MQIRPESEGRDSVRAVFAEHRSGVLKLLPEANVEHIGATAVEGSLTKGDLDLLVRVAAEDFERGSHVLREHYAIHQPENWTKTFASFKQVPEAEIPVGLQLVAEDSADDKMFIEWRDRLSNDQELLKLYNSLKLEHADDDPDTYADAKAEFIDGVLGD